MSFKNEFAQTIFDNKYARFPGQTWAEKAKEIVSDVTTNLMRPDDAEELEKEKQEKQQSDFDWQEFSGNLMAQITSLLTVVVLATQLP